MTRDVHHAGEDRDEVTMDDIHAEQDHSDAVFAGDYQVDKPEDEDPNYVGARPDELSSCRFCKETFETISAERTHECPGRKRLNHWDDGEDIPVILSRIHELGAHLLFADERDKMSPYFALVSQFDEVYQADDPDPVTFDGETWELIDEKTRPWEGGIATREQDHGETYYEYQIALVADDGLRDQEGREITLQFRPALPNAQTTDGSSIGSMPDDMPEGIRVQINSSNVDTDEVVPLIQAVADRLGIRPTYFAPEKIHDWSRCYNLARYVRTDRELNEEKITDRDALMDRLARFGSSNRGRGEYKWDNEEIQGHRTAVTMDATQWEKLLPNQHVGTLLKSYHMKHPEKTHRGSPTYHPKVEVQFSTEYSEVDNVPWRSAQEYDVTDLSRELDEDLVNCLKWAGFDVRANPDHYVADEYFEVVETQRDISLYEDPLETVEEIEGDLATKQFHREDVTDAERDVLKVLADGGRHDHEDLAEQSGTSTSTVYRALDKFANVVCRVTRGEYELADEVVTEKFQRLFRTVENAADMVDRSMSEVIANLDAIEEADNPFARWLQTYGITAEDRERFAIEVQSGEFDKYQIQKMLRRGLEAARETGSTLAANFLDAEVTWYNSETGRRTDEPFTIVGPAVRVFGNPLATVG